MENKKIYKLPLSEEDSKEVETIYEDIFLKPPHFNMKEQNILEAIKAKRPDIDYIIEDEGEDKPEEKPQTSTEEKSNDANEGESKTKAPDEKDSDEYKKASADYVKYFGVEPKENFKLSDILEANSVYEEAKQNTPLKEAKKPVKKSNPNLYKNIVKITKEGKETTVNRQTFDNFLKSQGWELVIETPKELK